MIEFENFAGIFCRRCCSRNLIQRGKRASHICIPMAKQTIIDSASVRNATPSVVTHYSWNLLSTF